MARHISCVADSATAPKTDVRLEKETRHFGNQRFLVWFLVWFLWGACGVLGDAVCSCFFWLVPLFLMQWLFFWEKVKLLKPRAFGQVRSCKLVGCLRVD